MYSPDVENTFYVIYIGGHWREYFGPRTKKESLREGLIFWAKTAKEWRMKMTVRKIPRSIYYKE